MDNLPHILPDIDLRPFNTLAVSARAREFCVARTYDELVAAIGYAREQGLTWLVLGGGSNVVLAEDIDGLVIRLELGGIDVVREDDHHAWVRAGAGVNWHGLVEHCLAFHYWGLENLALIPGTVGAAPIQNIGAYGVELSDRFAELQALDTHSLLPVTMDRDACQFGYRDSIFKHALKDRYIITAVTLKLALEPEPHADYPALRDALAADPERPLTPQRIFDTVCSVRRSKLPDPEDSPNVGSFFHNPVVDLATRDRLLAEHPDLVWYPAGKERAKLAAGWLIDRAGWKGQRRGPVAVHERQALVLVNDGGSGADVLALAEAIRADILARYGVALHIEPRIYP